MAGRGLTIEGMVKLARVSRASFYRFSEDGKPDRDMDLRDAIQRIALEWPSYGLCLAKIPSDREIERS